MLLLLAALIAAAGCSERESSIISKYPDKEIEADTSKNTPVPEEPVTVLPGDDPAPVPDNILTGTTWKLTYFVCAAEGLDKTPEPDSEQCYRIRFDSGNTLSGYTAVNEMFGEYELTPPSTFRMAWGGTKIGEPYPDGKVFRENMSTEHSYQLTDSTLKLSYNETDYFLFKLIPVPDNHLAGTTWKLAGFVDVKTGEVIEPTPDDCQRCYTLSFTSNTKGRLIYVANLQEVDLLKTPFFGIITDVYDMMNGNVVLLYEAIKTVDSYLVKDNELKFFYNSNNNYLLYKLTEE
jgi:heat shock protein HslJ